MEMPAVLLAPDNLRTAELLEPRGLAACQANELRAGDLCPACGAARLDYNGLLNLACPACGYSLGGGFT
jgi:predicted amidophosphoribosyltransferase